MSKLSHGQGPKIQTTSCEVISPHIPTIEWVQTITGTMA